LNNSNATVKSLLKALKVLEYFLNDYEPKSVTEIANALGYPKSTVSNILSTFHQEGFVEVDRQSGKYKLGIRSLELSSHTYQGNSVRRILHPYMEQLAEKTREEVLLATPSGFDVVYIGMTLFQGGVSRRYVIGSRAPMYCTAIGKAMLFKTDDEKIREMFNDRIIKFTENTITVYDKFIEHLNISRARGYAIDNMEHEYGIKCVAVPLYNQMGEIVAGISISGPSLRMSDETLEIYSTYLLEVASNVKRLLI